MTVNNLHATLRELTNPPREFSLLPFWFWNDDLEEAEILRRRRTLIMLVGVWH